MKTARLSPASSYGTINSDGHMGDQEEEQHLLRSSPEDEVEDELDGAGSDGAYEAGVQAGVRKIEAINQAWTQRSLIVAYIGLVQEESETKKEHNKRDYLCPLTHGRIFLMAFCTSLEGQTTASLAVYATSSFSKHSLVSTVLVVQNVVNGKKFAFADSSFFKSNTQPSASCDQTSNGEGCRRLWPI
jgi:hypothetical protein